MKISASVLEADLEKEARHSDTAVHLLAWLHTFSLPERYQLEQVYLAAKELNLKNVGVSGYAELAIKVCLWAAKQNRKEREWKERLNNQRIVRFV